jgi:hypothetical protein
MDELDLMQIPPQVQLGAHTLDVKVTPTESGEAHVELRHPNVGAKSYRVISTGIAADADGVLDWIRFVAPGVQGKLDAEARFQRKQLGYRA